MMESLPKSFRPFEGDLIKGKAWFIVNVGVLNEFIEYK